jgi:hypothetical protein
MIEELKGDLSFGESKGGVSPEDINKGKQAFIKRRNLPVDAHQVGAANDPDIFNKILAELKKGQDVEIVIRFQGAGQGNTSTSQNRHMVTITGAAIDADGNMTLHVNDPQSETKGSDSYSVEMNSFENLPWLPLWRSMGGFIEFAFADSPAQTATTPATPAPSTPATPTPTTPTPSTPTTPTPTTPTPSTPTTPTPTTPTTPTPPPPAPAALNVSGAMSYEVTHVQGTTACPTPIGSVNVSNSGGTTMTLSVSNSKPWLDLSGAFSTIAPGGSAPLSFQFNCTNYAVGAQSTSLSIQGTDSASGASAGQSSVSIKLTVQ